MNLEGRKEVNVDDIRLNYYEQGKGDPIIFIHGNGINGMDSAVFKKMYTFFSQQYNSIAIDSRGQGLSSEGKKHYSLELFADDIIEFCKIKNIKKVSLVGYSDGANIALLIAKKKPSLISNMVLISGNYEAGGICRWFRDCLVIYRKIFRFFAKAKKDEKLEKKIWLLDLMLNDIGITEEDLRNINIPTLILCADIDVVYIEHTRALHKNIKGSYLQIIKRCTHMNIVDKKMSIKAINKFFSFLEKEGEEDVA